MTLKTLSKISKLSASKCAKAEAKAAKIEEKANKALEKAMAKADKYLAKADKLCGKKSDKYEDKAQKYLDKGQAKFNKFLEKANKYLDKYCKKDDGGDDNGGDDDNDDFCFPEIPTNTTKMFFEYQDFNGGFYVTEVHVSDIAPGEPKTFENFYKAHLELHGDWIPEGNLVKATAYHGNDQTTYDIADYDESPFPCIDQDDDDQNDDDDDDAGCGCKFAWG